MTCTHEPHEMDTAVYDGMCPLCMAAEIERLQQALSVAGLWRDLGEENLRLRARIERLEAALVKARKPIWQWAPDGNETDQLLNEIDAALAGKEG